MPYVVIRIAIIRHGVRIDLRNLLVAIRGGVVQGMPVGVSGHKPEAVETSPRQRRLQGIVIGLVDILHVVRDVREGKPFLFALFKK